MSTNLIARSPSVAAGAVASSNHWQTPETWDPSANEVLVDVSPYDDEYWMVNEKLKQSMNDAHISKLWRVQNASQWKSFAIQKLRMEMQGESNLNERMVWHGTSKTDPSFIYDDKQDGFMMQYARQGRWGRGTYFAEKSSYSHDYSFDCQNSRNNRHPFTAGEREMFLCTLVEGRSKHMPTADNTLCVPPLDSSTGTRFNTVTAIANGSKIHVVYENGRAYPNYLVRYYRGDRDKGRTPLAEKPPLTHEWQFDGGDDGWLPYSTDHQTLLERAWKSNNSQIQLTTARFQYRVDLSTMTQTNTIFQTVRAILPPTVKNRMATKGATLTRDPNVISRSAHRLQSLQQIGGQMLKPYSYWSHASSYTRSRRNATRRSCRARIDVASSTRSKKKKVTRSGRAY